MKKRNKSRKTAAIARAKRTALGRALCRLLGDNTGGVMMEYVILAVLIAAAVVVAVAVFGKAIVGMFVVGTDAVTAQHTKAQSDLQATQQEANQGTQEAKDYHDSMHQ